MQQTPHLLAGRVPDAGPSCRSAARSPTVESLYQRASPWPPFLTPSPPIGTCGNALESMRPSRPRSSMFRAGGPRPAPADRRRGLVHRLGEHHPVCGSSRVAGRCGRENPLLNARRFAHEPPSERRRKRRHAARRLHPGPRGRRGMGRTASRPASSVQEHGR